MSGVEIQRIKPDFTRTIKVTGECWKEFAKKFALLTSKLSLKEKYKNRFYFSRECTVEKYMGVWYVGFHTIGNEEVVPSNSINFSEGEWAQLQLKGDEIADALIRYSANKKTKYQKSDEEKTCKMYSWTWVKGTQPNWVKLAEGDELFFLEENCFEDAKEKLGDIVEHDSKEGALKFEMVLADAIPYCEFVEECYDFLVKKQADMLPVAEGKVANSLRQIQAMKKVSVPQLANFIERARDVMSAPQISGEMYAKAIMRWGSEDKTLERVYKKNQATKTRGKATAIDRFLNSVHEHGHKAGRL